MKRNITLACLILALVCLCPMALADAVDPALIPEDTIAVVTSPKADDQPQILYAIHGLAMDEEFLTVSVRQICTEPELLIYEDDVANVTEEQIRQENGFTKGEAIVGSRCDAFMELDPAAESPWDRWAYPLTNSSFLQGFYLDESFRFPLSELKSTEEKLVLKLSYQYIAIPGTLDGHPLCQFTIDLLDYLP